VPSNVQLQPMQQGEAAASIDTKGYFVFRNVLSEAEIQNLHDVCRAVFKNSARLVKGGGQKQANAACEVPAVGWLFHHPGLLSCMRQALGSTEVMYTNHASLQNHVPGGWHKDDGTDGTPNDSGYFSRIPYGIPECRLVTTAVYLQDHDRSTTGLWVREGSHKTPAYDEGEIRYIGARAGDILTFDIRLTHSGGFKSKFESKVIDHLPNALRALYLTARRHYRTALGRYRTGVFCTFGLPNNYTIEFAKNAMTKQRSFLKDSNPRLSSTLHDALKANGVLLAEDHLWQE
jgi:hypothetical protein